MVSGMGVALPSTCALPCATPSAPNSRAWPHACDPVRHTRTRSPRAREPQTLTSSSPQNLCPPLVPRAYERLSEALSRVLPSDAATDVARRLGAGGLAGMAACAAAYPLDLVRTRLAAQTGRPGDGARGAAGTAVGGAAAAGGGRAAGAAGAGAGAGGGRTHPRYKGIAHALRTIAALEGPAGLYRGLGATLVQVSQLDMLSKYTF